MKCASELVLTLVTLLLKHEDIAHWVLETLVLASLPVACALTAAYLYRQDAFYAVLDRVFAFVKNYSLLFLQTYGLVTGLMMYIPWSFGFFTLHLGVSWWCWEVFNAWVLFFTSYGIVALPIILLLVIAGGSLLMVAWICSSFWLYWFFLAGQFIVLGGSVGILTGAFPAHRVYRAIRPPQQPELAAGPAGAAQFAAHASSADGLTESVRRRKSRKEGALGGATALC